MPTDKIENVLQPSLKAAFQGDFYLGAALSADQIFDRKPEAMALVARHFNSITPENILKWEEVHPKPGQYNFEAADRYVAFGEKHQMHIIGHTLIWWHQTPDWVFRDASGKPASREVLLERMKEHIFTVMGRYRGRIRGWDVVNEAINADGSWRKSRWYEILGEEHVARAFEFARLADPDAELYYNDFDLENRLKCGGVVRLVKGLQAKGIRVDGIGIQGHWFTQHPTMKELEDHFVVLGTLGAKLMITELDLGVLPYYPLESKIVPLSSFDAETQKKLNPYPDGLSDAAQKELAKRYADLFALFLKHRDKFRRITFWGVHDGQSWRNYWPITGRTEYPLLFDRHCQPKPAFDAVVQVGLSKD
jgi:endo-1,4-beta-xylanase